MSTEAPYQARILLEASKLSGVRVERRNVGTVRVHGTERRFRAGPPKGACDIGGVVGPGGWALYIECKVEGRKRTPEQIGYAQMVQEHGAIYLLADEKTRGVEQVIADLWHAVCERRGAHVPLPASKPTRRSKARAA